MMKGAVDQSYVIPCNIPDDILLKILVDLPVKSLSRFKSVSRSWRSLICSPQFINDHLHRSNKKRSSLRILRSVNADSFSISALGGGKPEMFEKFSERCWPVKQHHDSMDIWTPEIVGSWNGLVLLRLFNKSATALTWRINPWIMGLELLLWNPSTQHCRKISINSGIELDNILSLGLSYDLEKDEYKTVVLLMKPSWYCAEVLSFRGESSVRIQMDIMSKYTYFSNTDPSFNFKSVVLNGNPHWTFMYYVYRTLKIGLIYFNAVENKLEDLPAPDWLDGGVTGFIHLGVLDGMLCLAHDNNFATEIAVMKDYGVKNSWTRFFVIPASSWKLHQLYFVKKNWEIIILDGENSAFEGNLEYDSRRLIVGLSKEVITFSESLVCP